MSDESPKIEIKFAPESLLAVTELNNLLGEPRKIIEDINHFLVVGNQLGFFKPDAALARGTGNRVQLQKPAVSLLKFVRALRAIQRQRLIIEQIVHDFSSTISPPI